MLGFLKTSREADFSVSEPHWGFFSWRGFVQSERFENSFPKLPTGAVGSDTAHLAQLQNTGDLCASVPSQHLGVSCLTAVQGFKAGYLPGNIFKPRGELML